MDPVTIEQVKQVIAEKGFAQVGHHRCYFCGHMTAYVFEGEGEGMSIGFDSSCECGQGAISPREWAEFVDCFNRQVPEHRAEMWERFTSGRALYEAG